jgi:hypothetical protein
MFAVSTSSRLPPTFTGNESAGTIHEISRDDIANNSETTSSKGPKYLLEVFQCLFILATMIHVAFQLLKIASPRSRCTLRGNSAGRKLNKKYQVGLMAGIIFAAEILVSEEPWIEELQKNQQTQNNLHGLDSNLLRTY